MGFAMSSISVSRAGLIARSFSLAKVLCIGNNIYKYLYLSCAAYWLLSYGLSFWVKPGAIMFFIMFMPSVLQAIVVMMLGMRASTLLLNSQLHLVGIRKELFINLLFVCIVMSLPVFDPKNAENLINAKIISFVFLSTSMLLMLWLFSLQILSMVLLAVIVTAALCLIPFLGLKVSLLGLSMVLWSYFTYWLWRSPLQRMFKFENFNNFMEYLVERFKLVKYRNVMNRVINKEHVILSGEGDGHINRLFYSQAFTLIFTSLYLVVMNNSPILCLWMILMHLCTSRARIKAGQSHMKLWLLNSGDRNVLFCVTEFLSLRLYGYTFLSALMMLAIWIAINPSLAIYGIICLCVAQLFVMAADYYTGFIIVTGTRSLIVTVFLKMAFTLAIVFSHFDYIWYMVLALVIILLGIMFRNDAKKRFVSANLTLRAS